MGLDACQFLMVKNVFLSTKPENSFDVIEKDGRKWVEKGLYRATFQ